MGQSGWRLPDDLLRRVRVRAAETGVAQNVLVERALEKALGLPSRGDAPGVGGESRGPGVSTPAPSRASVESGELPAGDAMWEWSEQDGVVASVPVRKPSPKPVPSVRPARELLREGVDMDRQARVNALRDRKAKKP